LRLFVDKFVPEKMNLPILYVRVPVLVVGVGCSLIALLIRVSAPKNSKLTVSDEVYRS